MELWTRRVVFKLCHFSILCFYSGLSANLLTVLIGSAPFLSLYICPIPFIALCTPHFSCRYKVCGPAVFLPHTHTYSNTHPCLPNSTYLWAFFEHTLGSLLSFSQTYYNQAVLLCPSYEYLQYPQLGLRYIPSQNKDSQLYLKSMKNWKLNQVFPVSVPVECYLRARRCFVFRVVNEKRERIVKKRKNKEIIFILTLDRRTDRDTFY